MTTPTPDDGRLWAVTVTVPADLDEGDRDDLFDLIADAAHKWEPEDRDGWDIDVSAGEHTDAGGGYSCPVCAEARLAAEVAALRTAVRSLDSFVASTLGSVASMTEWDDDDWGISGFDSGTRAAIRRALTEDTGTDRELIAAHATPPVCTTCNGTRLKPWQLLTDSELAPALRTICDRTGTSIPCPDCTEDTTDTPTDRSIP